MNGRKEYVFWWFIENYNYCWHTNGVPLVSPKFTADEQEGAVWTLHLFPRGSNEQWKGNICLYLTKGNIPVAPENNSIKYKLSFRAADGSFLSSAEDEAWISVRMDEILSRRKPEYLPNDTLTVRCKMWIGEGINLQAGRSCARTRIGIEHISFVQDYRLLDPNQKKTFRVRSPSIEGRFITCNMYISDGACCEQKLIVEIVPISGQILANWELSLLDASGTIIESDLTDNRFEATVNDISKLSLCTFTKEVNMASESQHLPDNKLSFLCDCTFSMGLEIHKIEDIVFEMDEKIIEYIIDDDDAEKLSECPSALDDLKAIYTDQFLTDMEVKTNTKSFPAHKIVLCARSPVFKAMMTNDMREKSCDCIKIDDLEDDTVQQLLLFLYSDDLEDLQWETATKLYYAADKYGIEKLKVLCSDYLEDNLKTDAAIELLLLADTHNDSNLKKVVEDFILENNKQVFNLVEWEQLMETNPQLAVKTMHLMFKRRSK